MISHGLELSVLPFFLGDYIVSFFFITQHHLIYLILVYRFDVFCFTVIFVGSKGHGNSLASTVTFSSSFLLILYSSSFFLIIFS
jgi:hypothetical protein